MSSPEKGLFKSFFHFHWVVCRVPPSAPPGGVGGGESSLERSPRRGAPRAGVSLAGSQERRGSARGAGARSAKIVLCRADAAPPGRVLLGIGCGSPERGGDSPGSGRPGQSAPGTGGPRGSSPSAPREPAVFQGASARRLGTTRPVGLWHPSGIRARSGGQRTAGKGTGARWGGWRRERRITPELFGTVAKLPNLAAAGRARLWSKGFEDEPEPTHSSFTVHLRV